MLNPPVQAAAQCVIDKPAYMLYTDEGMPSSFGDMIEAMAQSDVIFFGEYHNSSVVHWLERVVFTSLADRLDNKLTLGMEMFEADTHCAAACTGKSKAAATAALLRKLFIENITQQHFLHYTYVENPVQHLLRKLSSLHLMGCPANKPKPGEYLPPAPSLPLGIHYYQSEQCSC